MNDKNLQFYKNIDISLFKDLSEKGGFSDYKDLDLIAPHIRDTDAVLELGAGFGRCLKYFVGKKHTGRLTGVEYSQPYVDLLKKEFEGKAEIIQADIKVLELPVKYNVALWMWSGIIDFALDQQLESCKRIFSVLEEGGKLFIDVPRLGIKTIASHIDAQNLVFKTEYGEINAFIPNVKDMEKIRREAGYSALNQIEYSTSTDKQRTIYVLIK